MSIDSILFDRLKDAGGLLFPIVGTKIYPLKAPQNTAAPYCVWTRIDSVRISAMGSDTPIVRSRIQIDGFAPTFSGLRALGAAIRSRVQRWRTAGPPGVQDTFLIDESEQDEASDLYPELRRVIIQVELIHEEP